MVKRGYTAALINQTKEKTPAGGTRASFKLNSDALARRPQPIRSTQTVFHFFSGRHWADGTIVVVQEVHKDPSVRLYNFMYATF